MRKLYLLMVTCMVALSALGANVQIVTTQPHPLQRGSQNIVLTYHADSPLGNDGLKNLGSNFDVYAHIGVITTKSTDDSDWKFTVTPWPTEQNAQTANTAKNRMTRVDANTYTLNIGDLKTYFGLGTGDVVRKIAVLFRNADGTKVGRTKNEGDIYVDVLANGFQTLMLTDMLENFVYEPTTVNFTFYTTSEADLKLYVNDRLIGQAAGAKEISGSYLIDEVGDYILKGTADYNGNTYTKTVEVSWPDESMKLDYPGGVPKMGAVKNADGSVTFCIAAPEKRSAVIVPSWDDYQVLEKNVMHYQDYNNNRYFWITVNGLSNNEYYPYYYLIDDKYKVADPYAHLILDQSNDKGSAVTGAWPECPSFPSDKVSGTLLAVYRGDMDDYNFSPFTIPSHDNLVIYELLLRDFTGTNGVASANGNVVKAMARIPYLKSLGVNVVELMPIMEFAGNNSWGYNTNFYMAPDKAYGSPKAYKDFIEECHRNGIAVVLDIVLNQSDGQHPWYQMYNSGKSPMYNAQAPHDFSVLNDWKQGHPLVEQQWVDALTYWLTAYNVDGFRFDLVKGLGDNDSYANGTGAYNQSRIDRMIRLQNVMKAIKPDVIHINEDLAGAQEEKVLGQAGQLQWANINSASRQFTMGYESDSNLYRFMATYDSGRPWGSTVAYAESHDEERIAYANAVWGVEGVKLPANTDETITPMSLQRLGQLAAVMLMTPGPKMIWQFGELGNGQSTKNGSDNNTGPKIVCWNYLEDPGRVYLKDTYAALINLRMMNPQLFDRTTSFSPAGMSSRFNVQRTIRLTNGEMEAILFVNPSTSASMDVSVASSKLKASNCQLIWATQGVNPSLTDAADGKVTVTLPANSFAVFATANVAGVKDVPVLEGSNVSVNGGRGVITINGDYTNAQVYDLSGRLMPGLDVPAGLYIVRVDGTAHKVIVR